MTLKRHEVDASGQRQELNLKKMLLLSDTVFEDNRFPTTGRGAGAMLESLSKQIAHCYFRAGECRKLAVRSGHSTDQQFYLEREQAWLSLARNYEIGRASCRERV